MKEKRKPRSNRVASNDGLGVELTLYEQLSKRAKVNQGTAWWYAELRTIREQFERWRGFVGGMLFVIGAFWTMLQFGFKALVDWGKG